MFNLLSSRANLPATENDTYVRRGSEYTQSTDWHYDANEMLGTTTSNFSDVKVDPSNSKSTPSSVVVKSPSGKTRRRSTSEQQWMDRGGSETTAEADNSEEKEAEKEEEGEELDVAQSSRSSMGFLLASIGALKKQSTKPVKLVPTKDIPCVVELRCAVNVPRMMQSSKASTSNGGGGGNAVPSVGRGGDNGPDDPGGTNPFVTMKVVPSKRGGEQRSKGVERRWPYKSNTLFPVWNKVRDLGQFREGDTLRIDVHHFGKVAKGNGSRKSSKSSALSQVIGSTEFVLNNVEIGREYPLRVGTKGKSGLLSFASALQQPTHKTHGDFMLFLRLLPAPAARKTVFIVRHAESNWNRAEKRLDVACMIGSVDHGLSQKGRTQAEQLWRRIELEACVADLMTQPPSNQPSGGGCSGGMGSCSGGGSRQDGDGGGGKAKEEEAGEGWVGFSRATPLREADLSADAVLQALVTTRSPEESQVAAQHIKKLWGADAVWSSPLTRTIQTTLVALQGHPMLRKNGIILSADAREIKGQMSRDSIGCAKGERAIRLRVLAEMAELYSSKAVASSESAEDTVPPADIVGRLLRPVLDASDASDEWWTGAFDKDKREDVDVRLNELLNSIKFAPASTIILVSHSNFFKYLLGRRLHKDLRARKPELARAAAELKMKNCALVRLEMDFSEDLNHCIVDMEPLFADDMGTVDGAFERKPKGRGSVRDMGFSSIRRKNDHRSASMNTPPRSAASISQPHFSSFGSAPTPSIFHPPIALEEVGAASSSILEVQPTLQAKSQQGGRNNDSGCADLSGTRSRGDSVGTTLENPIAAVDALEL